VFGNSSLSNGLTLTTVNLEGVPYQPASPVISISNSQLIVSKNIFYFFPSPFFSFFFEQTEVSWEAPYNNGSAITEYYLFASSNVVYPIVNLSDW
jgi:hypothetical protein